MKYEKIIQALSVNIHEKKGLVTALGQSTERPDWGTPQMFLDSYRQGFLGSQNVANRFEVFAHRSLQLTDDSYARYIVSLLVLEGLCLSPGTALTVDALAEQVRSVIERLRDEGEGWTRIGRSRREAYRVVLSAAWFDGVITSDELGLLERIRLAFGLSYRAHWVLEREIQVALGDGGKNVPIFPPRNLLNDAGDVELALVQGIIGKSVRYDLVRAGLLFPVMETLPDGRSTRELWALPDELADVLRHDVFDWELRPRTYRRLLTTEVLGSQKNLVKVAERFDLPRARSLDERRAFIVVSRVKPSEILEFFVQDSPDVIAATAEELGARVYKSARRTAAAILDCLRAMPDWKVADDPVTARMQKFVRYYDELARRDYPTLRDRGLIENDGDVDKAFEDATHFLINTRLNLVTERAGREAEDGLVRVDDGKVLLWDNKSCEVAKSHSVDLNTFAPQFKAYIDRHRRSAIVAAFLVIAPEFAENVVGTAMNLEIEWGCEVVAIRADDFLWLCDTWKARAGESEIDVRFFESTGQLTREIMEQRLSMRDWAVG